MVTRARPRRRRGTSSLRSATTRGDHVDWLDRELWLCTFAGSCGTGGSTAGGRSAQGVHADRRRLRSLRRRGLYRHLEQTAERVLFRGRDERVVGERYVRVRLDGGEIDDRLVRHHPEHAIAQAVERRQ